MKIICFLMYVLLYFNFIPTILSADEKIKTDVVKIIYPNGGEKLNNNSKIKIIWTNVNRSELSYIYLWDGLNKTMLFIDSVNGTEYFWEIPENYSGSRYRMKIVQGSADSKCIDFSDNFFFIRNYDQNIDNTSDYQKRIVPRKILDNTEISVYPSPSSDYLKIKFINDIEIAKIFISDINGKIIYPRFNKISLNEFKINTSNLFPGTYFLFVLDLNGNKFDQKVIIN